MQLKDKVMIVTGASSGIGEAIAKAAAAAGARLMLTGRSVERGERVRTACGAGAQFIPGDVSQPTAWSTRPSAAAAAWTCSSTMPASPTATPRRRRLTRNGTTSWP